MAKIPANTIHEFIKNANKHYDGDGAGATTPKHSYKYASFSKQGQLVKLQVTFSVDIDFAEPGPGHPDPINKTAIALVSDLAKKHEQKHKAGYEAAFKEWNDKVPDDLMKKTFKNKNEAEKAVDDQIKVLDGKLKQACLELHKTEGRLEVRENKDGSIDVFTKAAGATGCG